MNNSNNNNNYSLINKDMQTINSNLEEYCNIYKSI